VATVTTTGENALDEITDPTGNVSWDMGALTLTIQGTTYNCIFSDGDLTCTGDGGITAPKFTTSGSDPYFKCVDDGSTSVTEAGEFCFDSTDKTWDFWLDNGVDAAAKYAMATTASTQTFTNKTFLWFKWIPAGSGPDLVDNAEVQDSPYSEGTSTSVPYIAYDDPEEIVTVRFTNASNAWRGYYFLIPDGWMGDGTDEEKFKIRWVGYNSAATGIASGEIVEFEITGRFLESTYAVNTATDVNRGTPLACQYTAPDNLATEDLMVTGWCEVTGTTDGTWDDEKILEIVVKRDVTADTYEQEVDLVGLQIAAMVKRGTWASLSATQPD
jgi:hypothetical protein